jgi:hypothetical protein
VLYVLSLLALPRAFCASEAGGIRSGVSAGWLIVARLHTHYAVRSDSGISYLLGEVSYLVLSYILQDVLAISASWFCPHSDNYQVD